MEAPGPAALMPAQVTQLSQPLILWICDLTVWADEETETAENMNSAITRPNRPLVVFFTITTLLQGVCFCADSLSNGEAESNDASTLLQPFSTRCARNRKSRISR